MDNNLTEKENNFLKKLYKSQEMIHYSYIAAGFLGCISILGIILGINFHDKDGFLMAIYFGTISIVLILKTKNDTKIIKIINKLQERQK